MLFFFMVHQRNGMVVLLQESPRPGDCLKAAPEVEIIVRDPSGERRTRCNCSTRVLCKTPVSL